tara:strand:+ start:1220 stop:1909 length:690 start_codon:yes stop_codon:yes gene_type:complete
MTLSETYFHLSRVSSNKKTGPIAVTTTSKNSCPASCGMRDFCYAASGPLAMHWAAVSDGRRSKGWREHLDDLATLPFCSPLRLNQAGDLVASAKGRLSKAFIDGLLSVVKSRRLQAWSYTHHDHTIGDNGKLLRRANREGLRVNVSTETEASADQAIKAGLPAVLAVSSEETRTTWRTPDRNLVKVCPAQLQDTDCNRCMLCHKRGSKVIIAFLAHGSRKNRANQQLNP